MNQATRTKIANALNKVYFPIAMMGIICFVMMFIVGTLGLSVTQEAYPDIFDESIISYDMMWIVFGITPLLVMLMCSIGMMQVSQIDYMKKIIDKSTRQNEVKN